MAIWECIDAERTERAELLGTLTPEQWDMPSLCTAWRVRDVAAHVNEAATLSTGAGMVLVLRYGFRIGTMLEREAIKGGGAPTTAIVADTRARIGRRTTPPGVKPPGVLADEVIHQQDIRRVVGIRREIAEEPLAMAGRPVALEELDGPGVATLRSRL